MRRAWRRLLLGGYWAAIFSITHWPHLEDLLPEYRWLPERFDLVVHFGMYAGWTAAWWIVLAAAGPLTRRHVGWLLAGGLGYGVFDELTQAVVQRTPAISDLLADSAGVVAASVLLWRWQERRRGRPAQRAGLRSLHAGA